MDVQLGLAAGHDCLVEAGQNLAREVHASHSPDRISVVVGQVEFVRVGQNQKLLHGLVVQNIGVGEAAGRIVD